MLLDGKKFFLSPESTILAQKAFGADIIIPLDELPPYHIERQRLVDSVNLSHRWEARSLQQHLKNVNQQAMYCVVHGGIDVELRTKSVEYLTSLPFDGYAIGGSLGNGHDELFHLLRWMMPMFDATDQRRGKPRHLLGIADETSIGECVSLGIDTVCTLCCNKFLFFCSLFLHPILFTAFILYFVKQTQFDSCFRKFYYSLLSCFLIYCKYTCGFIINFYSFFYSYSSKSARNAAHKEGGKAPYQKCV
jgi:hypothetical protein